MGKRMIYKVKEVPSQRLAKLVHKHFLSDFKRYGMRAVERVREEDPGKYLDVIAKILPKQVDIGVQHSFSDVLLQAAAAMKEQENQRVIDGKCQVSPNGSDRKLINIEDAPSMGNAVDCQDAAEVGVEVQGRGRSGSHAGDE